MRQLKEKWIKEFISLGPVVEVNGEKLRPNTRTNIAIGKITALQDASGKDNLKAVMKVTGAKYDFSGFINANTPVADLLKQAQEKDAPVCVRFERKRKKEADPHADIMELTKDTSIAQKNVVWVVSGIFNYNTNEWILTDSAVSNPNEDPEYVLQEIKAASYSTENFFEGNAPKLKTSDLEWKANHLMSMFTYACEHNKEFEVGLSDEEIKVLAKFMLKSSDLIQMKIKNIREPNYNDYSHTKARGILFSWMRVNPLTREIFDSKPELKKWLNRSLEENKSLVDWAYKELGLTKEQ